MNRNNETTSIRDWVNQSFDSRVEPMKFYEKTQVFSRDPRELLDGIDCRELDPNDTIPAELIDILI